MGNNPKTSDEILAEGGTVTVEDTEDIYVFLSTRKGEIFGCKVSVEVCCEKGLEDKRCDFLIDLSEAVTKTVVGMYGLTQKAHMSEHKGDLIFNDRGDVESA